MEVVIRSKISMPQGGKIFQGDKNMDYILVQIDRFYGDFDLVDYNAYLKIQYVDDSCNQIILDKIIERSDRLIYEAKIDDNFTRYPGEILCQPYFTNSDGTMCFNASVFTMEVESSIQAYETIEQDMLPGTLQTLEAELKYARQQIEDSMKSELGEVAEEDVESAIHNLTETAIYKFTVVKSDGYKEPRVLFVNRVDQYTATQTMLLADQNNFNLKYIARAGSVAAMTLWQVWTEYEYVSKEYVDFKFLELRYELGLEIS